MDIERWQTPVDIDALGIELKQFLIVYKKLQAEASAIIQSHLLALDERAGVDSSQVTKFKGYRISLPSVDISSEFLPKVIADRIGDRNCSVTLTRELWTMDLEIIDLETGKIVGGDVQSNPYQKNLRDAGIRIQTPERELEHDPENGSKFNLADEPINESDALKVVATAVLFSKVINHLLSPDAELVMAEGEDKPSFKSRISS